MPGAYAHITLVNILSRKLEEIDGFPLEAIPVVLDYLKFCELGAVSPDYPYLALGDNDAKAWADEMHHPRTGQVIHSGIRHLRGLDGETKRKCLAWLFGYAAHVAMDVTVHPVVERKVGKYEGNEKNHRVCEMNQDAHIFQRMKLGGIGVSEHLDGGIRSCGSPGDARKLDPDVRAMWDAMLGESYPDEYADNRPDIDKWHGRFGPIVDNIVSEGNRLLPWARHLAVDSGLAYPEPGEIDDQYIRNLDAPAGKMSYDAIFDRAVLNAGGVWKTISRAVFNDDDAYATSITLWDLDSGKNENGQLVFWG